MTLSRVVVDASYVTKPGQLATAIGRASTIEGLHVLNFHSSVVAKQPESVLNFYIHVNTNSDCTCNESGGHTTETTDMIDDDNNDENMDIDTCIAGADDDDDDDDDDNDIDLDRMMVRFEEDKEYEPDAALPLGISLLEIRRSVKGDFEAGETPEQRLLCDRELAMGDAMLHKYLSGQLCHLEALYVYR